MSLLDPLAAAEPTDSAGPHDPLARPLVIGAGPVGRTVAACLIEDGRTPTVITRSGSRLDDVRSITADVSDSAQARQAISGATVVFQCAQPAYHRWPQEFPTLQRSVLDACHHADAVLIAAENTYGYGDARQPLSSDLPMRPCSVKGRVRAEMWAELASAHRSGRVRTAAVRASDFFGPGVDGSAYGSRFFDSIRSGKNADVMLSADALHSVTFVDDFARALVAVAADPTAWGRAWHAPTAPAVSQRELVERTAQIAGTKSTARVMSRWQMRLVGIVVKEVREMIELAYEFENDHVVDSSEFEQRFGIGPTPLDTSLAVTIAGAS